MEEESTLRETKDKLEEITGHMGNWNRYLALSTAFIAVFAAVASLQSGSYANEAVLKKNDAVLFQNKATDQWNYYQDKGIKKNIAQAFYTQNGDDSFKTQIDRYTKEQKEIQIKAREYEKLVSKANDTSQLLFEKHHKEALAVTFFQIAIALSAMSALLRRKSFWIFSIATGLLGIYYFIIGLTLR